MTGASRRKKSEHVVHPSARGLRNLWGWEPIEFRPEPLYAAVDRRLKAIRAARSFPSCGEDSLHALEDSERIWCGRCHWKTTYTRGTPFYDSELAAAEFL